MTLTIEEIKTKNNDDIQNITKLINEINIVEDKLNKKIKLLNLHIALINDLHNQSLNSYHKIISNLLN